MTNHGGTGEPGVALSFRDPANANVAAFITRASYPFCADRVAARRACAAAFAIRRIGHGGIKCTVIGAFFLALTFIKFHSKRSPVAAVPSVQSGRHRGARALLGRAAEVL